MSLQLTRYQFSVEEYDRMVQAGVLPEDVRVELVDGELLEMTPIGRRHAAVVNRLNRLFAPVASHVLVSVQNPIRLDDHSEPQPDLLLLRPRPDDYEDSLPTPRDVLLLIEVAESSADYDRSLKAPLYARAGVPEYWVVDLHRAEVVVWRQPAPEGYREERVMRRGDQLTPDALPGTLVEVGAILR